MVGRVSRRALVARVGPAVSRDGLDVHPRWADTHATDPASTGIAIPVTNEA